MSHFLHNMAMASLLIGAAVTPVMASSSDNNTDGKPSAMIYEAPLMNTKGTETGTVTLTQTDAGVLVHVKGKDLPEGEHGFHIHETGSCTPQDTFEDAGGHFNPEYNKHGYLHEDGAHAGDMPNIFVASNGTVETETLNTQISLIEGEDGYLLDEDGSAVMIHEGADDYKSQTSGDAGNRVACAEIK